MAKGEFRLKAELQTPLLPFFPVIPYSHRPVADDRLEFRLPADRQWRKVDSA